jgi:hypothetical protein
MFTYFQYGALCHFQQYFSYIVGSILLVEETAIPGENLLSIDAITSPESLYSDLLID